jgi:hypothetical protein
MVDENKNKLLLWMIDKDLESLHGRMDRVINGTCNAIGCAGCPLVFLDGTCESNHLQDKIMDLEYGDPK